MGFQAACSLGTDAFNQCQRDRPALFPDAIEADFRKIDFVRDTFIPDHIDQITGDGPLAKFWGDLVPAPNVPNATEVLYMAIAADRPELFIGDGVRSSKQIVAELAAANPQRLFTLAPASIGTGLIQDLLSVAEVEFAAGGRALGGVLFGATLRDAIVMALQAAAGNAQAAIAHQPLLKTLASQLSELVREKPDRLESEAVTRDCRDLATTQTERWEA